MKVDSLKSKLITEGYVIKHQNGFYYCGDDVGASILLQRLGYTSLEECKSKGIIEYKKFELNDNDLKNNYSKINSNGISSETWMNDITKEVIIVPIEVRRNYNKSYIN